MESQSVYTKQQRIAELAGQTPRFRMVSLNRHLDMDWMREAYRQTRKSGAPGVDGITAAEYERNLEANLADLLERHDGNISQAAQDAGVDRKTIHRLLNELGISARDAD